MGVAPFGVAVTGHKAYVNNWGGRRPEAGSLTGPAGRGTLVRVDPVHYIVSEGSVSIIDLDGSATTKENAVDVIRFKPRESKLLGLIPVDWFPAAAVFDARRNRVRVANLRFRHRRRPAVRLGSRQRFSHDGLCGQSLIAFEATPNLVLLDQMNPPAKKISDSLLRKDAYASARLPLARPDQCPDNLLNRILGRAMADSHRH